MPFRGFEGPAGSGKTHRVMESVGERLAQEAMLPHQKVLALTFMHGSRRRLDEELRLNPLLRGKSVAMTIDSFALQVLTRWRSLAAALGLETGDFNANCNSCGQLLENPQVAKWVARSYPVILVDEAQELAPPRLRIVSALAPHASVFVAADEFQCLNEEIDTGPFMEWFQGGDITQLNHIHRTAVAGLLNAGANLRQLVAPAAGPGLTINYYYKNYAPFRIGAAIHYAQGTRAVLFPPAGRDWAEAIAQRLSQGLHSATYNIPPIRLILEPHASDEIAAVMAVVGDGDVLTPAQVGDRFAQLENPPRWVSQVTAAAFQSMIRQGKTLWTAPELGALVDRKAASFRAHASDRVRGIPLLGIHQAKNRQFDHVVILWPHGVPGSDELKARLLYNGITRARRTCKVFVRGQNLLQQAPFVFNAA
jgi:hypothetical protein